MSARLTGFFQKTTDKAVCVRTGDDPDARNADTWIPLSVIEDLDFDPETAKRGDPVELDVAGWWAEKEGLE